jgi:RNA polymerase sigma-70 factor, ECF subfamily
MEVTMLIEELYAEFFEQLEGYASSLSRKPEVAEELVQETFARAQENTALLAILPKYKQRSWLFTVLKNCFYDFKRKEKFTTILEEDFEVEDGEDLYLVSDIKDMVHKLPAKYRKILYKRFYLGMNSSDISKMLKIPAATIRFQIHTAINLLRKEYE